MRYREVHTSPHRSTPTGLRAAEGELSSYFTAPQRLAALFETRRYA
jgi:hypothetical protein